MKQLKSYSIAEVKKHNSRNSCWIIIQDEVLDVTKWLKSHPGGELPILALAGADATDNFVSFHPKESFAKLSCFKIGSISHGEGETPKAKQVMQDFYQMKDQMVKDGIFHTSYLWYYQMVMFLGFLLSIAISGAIFSDKLLYNSIAAIAMGLYFQQASFLGHDLCHNSVTKIRKLDTVCAMIASSTLGVSPSWWKATHNVHHVVTNSVQYDPDIQHLPIFAISEKFFGSVFSKYHMRTLKFDKVAQVLVSYQHLLYYPVMAFARLNLYAQSLILLIFSPNKIFARALDITCMIIFYSWYSMVLYTLSRTSVERAVGYFLVSHVIGGILHVQITASHFGVPVYDETLYTEGSMPFLMTQLLHSIDIECSPMIDWFHGGLQFQVEHHLFPKVPRHNLRIVKEKYLMPFCKKNDLPYQSKSFLDANALIYNRLKETAMLARTVPEKSLHPSFWATFNAEG